MAELEILEPRAVQPQVSGQICQPYRIDQSQKQKYQWHFQHIDKMLVDKYFQVPG